jgi:hypothetical protein
MLVASMLLSAVSAFASSCVHPPPGVRTFRDLAEWHIKDTPVIFEGKAEKVEITGWQMKPVPGKTFSLASIAMVTTFSGIRTYRGHTLKRLKVKSWLLMGTVGYRFNAGESYLVYAWPDEHSGDLYDSICSGTQPLAHAGAALRLLRGEPPTAEDLADRHDDADKGISSAEVMPAFRLCSQLTFPPEVKSDAVKVYLWPTGADPQRMPIEETGGQGAGAHCFLSLYPGKYILGAFEDNEADDLPSYGS